MYCCFSCHLKPVQEKKSLVNKGHLSQFFDFQGKDTTVTARLGTKNVQKFISNSEIIFLKILALPGENIKPHNAWKNVVGITESLRELITFMSHQRFLYDETNRQGLSKVYIRFFKEPTVTIDNLYFQYHLRKKCDTIPLQLNRVADFYLDSTNLPLRHKLSCQDEGNFARVWLNHF